MNENESKKVVGEVDNTDVKKATVDVMAAKVELETASKRKKTLTKTLIPMLIVVAVCIIAVVAAVIIVNENNRKMEAYNAMLASERAEMEASERAAEEKAQVLVKVNEVCSEIMMTHVENMDYDKAFGELDEVYSMISEYRLGNTAEDIYNKAHDYVLDCRSYKRALEIFDNTAGNEISPEDFGRACSEIDSIRTEQVKEYFWQENQWCFEGFLEYYAESIFRTMILYDFQKRVGNEFPEHEILDIFYIDDDMYRYDVYGSMQEVSVFGSNGKLLSNDDDVQTTDVYIKNISLDILNTIDNEMNGSGMICILSDSRYVWHDYNWSVLETKWQDGDIVFKVNRCGNIEEWSGSKISAARYENGIGYFGY